MRGDEAAQLVLGDRLASRVRVAAEQPDEPVGRVREQPDHGTEERGDLVQRRREQLRGALGALQREPLRGEFADDEGDEGDDQRDADDAGGRREAVAPAVVDQEGLRFVGQRDGAERARQQRGGRDADLDGAEEPVRVADRAWRPSRRAGWPRPARAPAPRAARRARSRPRRRAPRSGSAAERCRCSAGSGRPRGQCREVQADAAR